MKIESIGFANAFDAGCGKSEESMQATQFWS